MWWGLLIGVVLGGLAGEWTGAFYGGVIGWIVGLVISSKRKPVQDDRLAKIEARLAALEVLVAQKPSERPAAAPTPVAPIPEPPLEFNVPEVQAATSAPEPEPPPTLPPVEPPRAAAPPPPPREPAKPNPIVAWFTGGNTIARVGIVVLFIGVAFLMRYAVEHAMFPPELRVASAGFAGIVLLALGWRLSGSRPGYALSLQGAGVGLLYLTVFGAFRLYGLIPPTVAFPLLVLIAALATWLAVKQDSEALAGFGAAGGFIAPILASTGQGNHVTLFSYYAVLNLAILGTAWFRSWRSLNLLGFGFTFVIGVIWGVMRYEPRFFETTEPFLIFFFLLYVAVAVLFARRESSPAGRLVDGTLVFGVPLVGFGLQAALLKDTEYGLAFSSLALAAFYLGLAALLHKRAGEAWKLLVRCFLALGVVFITLAIPLAFDARWTSAAWAVEGAAVLWMGARQGRRLPVLVGFALQIVAGVLFAESHERIPMTYPLMNGVFLGALLIAASGLFSHRILRSTVHADWSWLRPMSAVLFVWALLWWLMGAHEEAVERLQRGPAELAVMVAVLGATVLVFAWLHRNGEWPEAAWPSAALLPVLAVLLLLSLKPHPFAEGGWLAWPFALGAHYWARRRLEGATAISAFARFQHAGAFVLMALLGALELRWAAMHSGLAQTAWSAAALVLVPSLLVLAASSPALERRWPFGPHGAAYLREGALPILAGLLAWMWFANLTRPGPSTPLPYIPLLNAIDLGHILIVLTVSAWWLAVKRRAVDLPTGLDQGALVALLGATGFLWANAILLRTLHHWSGIPYDPDAWLRSVLVQASLSIFWTVLALGLMLYATRKAVRLVWMIGAGLMAVVVLKLLFVDLSALSGLERIVSFIGVGVLMLVIGYFSPVPPRKEEAAA